MSSSRYEGALPALSPLLLPGTQSRKMLVPLELWTLKQHTFTQGGMGGIPQSLVLIALPLEWSGALLVGAWNVHLHPYGVALVDKTATGMSCLLDVARTYEEALILHEGWCSALSAPPVPAANKTVSPEVSSVENADVFDGEMPSSAQARSASLQVQEISPQGWRNLSVTVAICLVFFAVIMLGITSYREDRASHSSDQSLQQELSRTYEAPLTTGVPAVPLSPSTPSDVTPSPSEASVLPVSPHALPNVDELLELAPRPHESMFFDEPQTAAPPVLPDGSFEEAPQSAPSSTGIPRFAPRAPVLPTSTQTQEETPPSSQENTLVPSSDASLAPSSSEEASQVAPQQASSEEGHAVTQRTTAPDLQALFSRAMRVRATGRGVPSVPGTSPTTAEVIEERDRRIVAAQQAALQEAQRVRLPSTEADQFLQEVREGKSDTSVTQKENRD